MSDWQPISTAPDGERVLVYDPKMGEVFVAARRSHFADEEDVWESFSLAAFMFEAGVRPSHWMPIPSAPTGASVTGASVPVKNLPRLRLAAAEGFVVQGFEDGGRDRDRTCDPHDVNVMLFR